jgi:hypothetical protein
MVAEIVQNAAALPYRDRMFSRERGREGSGNRLRRWCASSGSIDRGFIASGGRGQGDQKLASAVVLAAFGGRSGHGGLGGVLGGCRLDCGGLWVCSGASRAVGIVQEEEGLGGGLGACLSFPPFLTARVRAGGAGLDRGIIQEHGDSAWASWNSAAPVNSIWFDFSLPVFDEMPARDLNLNF